MVAKRRHGTFECLCGVGFSCGGGGVGRGERERDGVNYYEDDNYEEFLSKLVK